MKQKIRLTESDLHRIIKESVRRVMNEHDFAFDEMLDSKEDVDWMRAEEIADNYVESLGIYDGDPRRNKLVEKYANIYLTSPKDSTSVFWNTQFGKYIKKSNMDSSFSERDYRKEWGDGEQRLKAEKEYNKRKPIEDYRGALGMARLRGINV